jgi:hypothetical protein
MIMMKGDPPAIDPNAEDAAPDPAFMEGLAGMIQAMRDYDEELRRAGVLLAEEGLHPSWTGTRIMVDGSGRRRVLDGPFSETKETIAGFYLIDVSSKEEAIEWASRCPVELAIKLFGGPGSEAELEIRQVADMPEGADESAVHAVEMATTS